MVAGRGCGMADATGKSNEPPRSGGRIEADGPSSPRAPLAGEGVRPSEDRQCEVSHRQGCAPRPILSFANRIRAMPGKRDPGGAPGDRGISAGKLGEVQSEGEAS